MQLTNAHQINSGVMMESAWIAEEGVTAIPTALTEAMRTIVLDQDQHLQVPPVCYPFLIDVEMILRV